MGWQMVLLHRGPQHTLPHTHDLLQCTCPSVSNLLLQPPESGQTLGPPWVIEYSGNPWFWVQPLKGLETWVFCLLKPMPSCEMREAICPNEAICNIQVYKVSDEPSPLAPAAIWPQLQEKREENHPAEPSPPKGLWEGTTKYCLKPLNEEITCYVANSSWKQMSLSI